MMIVKDRERGKMERKIERKRRWVRRMRWIGRDKKKKKSGKG